MNEIPQGILLQIVEGRSLTIRNVSSVHPHCVLYVNNKLWYRTDRTDPIKGKWQSSVVLPIEESPKLRLEVWDWYRLNSLDLIGVTHLDPLYNTVRAGKTIDVWRQLSCRGTKVSAAVRVVLQVHKQTDSLQPEPCEHTVLDEAVHLLAPVSSSTCLKEDSQKLARLDSSDVNNERLRKLILSLVDLLQGPQDIRRKELVVQTIHKISVGLQDNRNRLKLASITYLPRLLMALLSRDDYLFTDVQRLILNVVISPRCTDELFQEVEAQVDEIRQKIVDSGLGQLQTRLWSTDLNASYTRNVEIIRGCTSPKTSEKLYSAVGPLLLSKLSEKTKYETFFRKALLWMGDHDRKVQESILIMATSMLAAYIAGQPYLWNPPEPVANVKLREYIASSPTTVVNFRCLFPFCTTTFANQQLLHQHVKTEHEEHRRIFIMEPMGLASLISSIEKANPRSSFAGSLSSGFFFKHKDTNSLKALEKSPSSVGGSFLGIKQRTLIGCRSA
eukprot:TRINITY_DN12813_c0_g1_i1.p1 TRINITY_DN12813_c0_g1~~TRINITY_DN12813_c0_g1_i1.p1  ORF type:complete len:501 (-),score=63.10 TRINITY_DN12813_c0_g1_i1:15-1517(-)